MNTEQRAIHLIANGSPSKVSRKASLSKRAKLSRSEISLSMSMIDFDEDH